MKDILMVGIAAVGIYAVLKMIDQKLKNKVVVPEYNLTNAPVKTKDSEVVVYQPAIDMMGGDMDVVAWTRNE